MAKTTLAIGAALIVIGVAGFLPHRAPTALIPSYFGAALVLAGLAALKPSLRMHAMHFAVVVALIGFSGSAWRLARAAITGTAPSSLAVLSQLCTALLMLLLIILCVRSFIRARQDRLTTSGSL